MKRVLFFVLLNLIVIFVFPQEKRIALVIGNSAYQFGGELENPVHDARSIEQVLKMVGFDVIRYENLDQKTMRQAIDNFGGLLKDYDVGLFFYAGHGVQSNGFNYLIPVDAVLASEIDVEYNCVRADRILGRMEDASNKTNIVILDACRNNPFERSWTRSATGKGLAFMNAPTGSLIAYATSPGNTASDGTNENGLYTSALLHYMIEPNITAIQMFQQVRTMVRENSDGQQIPWESTSLEGDFFFNVSGETLDKNTIPIQNEMENEVETSERIADVIYNINDSVYFLDERDNINFGKIVDIHENTNLYQISYEQRNRNKACLVEPEDLLITQKRYGAFETGERIATGATGNYFYLIYGRVVTIFPTIKKLRIVTDDKKTLLVPLDLSIALNNDKKLPCCSSLKSKCSIGDEVYFYKADDNKIYKGIISDIRALNIDISYSRNGKPVIENFQKANVFKVVE